MPDHSGLVLRLALLILLTAGTSTGQSARAYQKPEDPDQAIYRIEVEDSVEAGLIELMLTYFLPRVVVQNRNNVVPVRAKQHTAACSTLREKVGALARGK